MLTSNELFSRERLVGYDPDCLAGSVALVAGAGALGQNTAQNLALAGIGEMRIVDKDLFEEHNRTRSPAYPLEKEKNLFGLSKARVVASKLKRVMTASRPIMRYANRWIQELGDGAFKGVSVIVSCVDTQKGRAYLSDMARFHGIPFIEGGFDGPDVSLSCYPPAKGDIAQAAPCWRCSHPNLVDGISCTSYAALAEEAGIIPAIQNAAATLAGLQSEAAILAVHSENIAPAEFIAFNLNVRTLRAQKIQLATDPICSRKHRYLDHPPTCLETSADDTVEHLLHEISDNLGGAPTIELNSPLMWSAPCVECSEMASVQSPYWLWEINARCERCGGPFPAIENYESGPSAMLHHRLSLESNDRILSATCRQVGLSPLSIVKALDECGKFKAFELSGTIDELFELGDDYGE